MDNVDHAVYCSQMARRETRLPRYSSERKYNFKKSLEECSTSLEGSIKVVKDGMFTYILRENDIVDVLSNGKPFARSQRCWFKGFFKEVDNGN